ncbi:P-loop containing nucleoside triphosphate hydrolase protein [Suillus paluster]|uniref:P-loop containing nucleoside triphosphate hydrolase protein n=1 Tax=Suillus paluster TaxID=48578 RepID=UPI001B871733|nr:P-loop containing nucleoside triphosphate hydrolase protein [Suillus paluster]KAG1728289.1 P-loop containing nucleoside triphosphate hydrolase protein [Suillus paluster]
MASNALATQFQGHLNEFQISLEPSALNYLTSMLAVMSMSDKAKGIRDATEMFLEEADVDPEKINQFYATFGQGCVKTSSGTLTSVSGSTTSAENALPLDPPKPMSAIEARRMKRAQKKAAAVASPSPSTETEPKIVATAQQSRFHRETLVTSSKDIDMQTVNITVNNLDILVDAHLRLKEGVRYGLVGQNGVGKTMLMKCMADNILAMPSNLNILHIAQLEIFDESTTVLNEVLEADKACTNALREYEVLHAIFGDTPQSTSSNTAQLNIALHNIFISRMQTRVIAAQQLALKRSGARGYDARQAQVAIEIEFTALKAQDPQVYISPDMANDLITDVFDKFALIDLDARKANARKILRGLGFEEAQVEARVQTLSGGWRMQIALAKALFVGPDILLLDEPSTSFSIIDVHLFMCTANHLDLPAILWLQEYLINETAGLTLVVVSHDRAFLNAVTTETIILRDKILKYHAGSFADYESTSEEQRVRKQGLLDLQAKKRAKIAASIQHDVQQARATGDDKRLGQVTSRKKKLERLGMEKMEDGKRFKVSYWAGYHTGVRAEIEIEKAVRTTAIKIPDPPPLRYHGSVFTVKNASFRYPTSDKDVLIDVSLDVGPHARIALLGPNGCGKTTLLNMMVGVTQPTVGEVYRHPSLRIGYFSQHAVDQLTLTHTPIEEMRSRHPGLSEQECRAHFGTVGVSGNTVLRKIADLSGGQRNRIALAMILYDAPHVLVLDEITNHLDMGTVDRLVEALEGFEGALVLVSHDVWFMKQLMEGEDDNEDESDVKEERTFYVVRNGAVKRWEKDMDGYVEAVMKKVKK